MGQPDRRDRPQQPRDQSQHRAGGAALRRRRNRLQEGMLNRVSAVVRAYDPCLSCSTHAGGIVPLRIELLGAQGEKLDEVSSGA